MKRLLIALLAVAALAETPPTVQPWRRSGGIVSTRRATDAVQINAGYFWSVVPNNLTMSEGAVYDGANYIAKATDSSQIHFGAGNIEFFIDTGLTPGNPFTPTRRGYFAGSQFLTRGYGSPSLPSIAIDDGAYNTGMYWDGTPGIGMTIAGQQAALFKANSNVLSGTTNGLQNVFKLTANKTGWGNITGQVTTVAGGSTAADHLTLSIDSGYLSFVTGGGEAFRCLHGMACAFGGKTDAHTALGAAGLPVYANNAAAVAGGLTAGDFYRTGADPDPVMVVH